ncbi:hypothetical protein [Paenibacillus sp. FSL W8-0194]|uniref:hypothetical protein n=1 Tax=Paenibacillus sp. FSL W8-0194 TaxID=2921711 RepID=UPI0030D98B30
MLSSHHYSIKGNEGNGDAWGQGELFPTANEAEVQRTKFLLGKYKEMTLVMQDFEKFEEELKQTTIDGEVARRIDQEDLHADKPVLYPAAQEGIRFNPGSRCKEGCRLQVYAGLFL